MIGYGIWMALLTVAFYAFPSWHMATWGAIGVTSAAAVAVGLGRNRPRRRLPWLLISVALLAFAAGDTVYNMLTDVLGEVDPFPSAADVLYLAMFPLLATGLLSLARGRSGGFRLDRVLRRVGCGRITPVDGGSDRAAPAARWRDQRSTAGPARPVVVDRTGGAAGRGGRRAGSRRRGHRVAVRPDV